MHTPHWGISVNTQALTTKAKATPQVHASIIGRCRQLLAATQDEFYLEILQKHLSDFPEAWDVAVCPAIVLPLNPAIGGKEAQAC